MLRQFADFANDWEMDCYFSEYSIISTRWILRDGVAVVHALRQFVQTLMKKPRSERLRGFWMNAD